MATQPISRSNPSIPDYLRSFVHPGVMIIAHPEAQTVEECNNFCVNLQNQNPNITIAKLTTLVREKIFSNRLLRVDVSEDYFPSVTDRICHDRMLKTVRKKYLFSPIQEMGEADIKTMLCHINSKLFSKARSLEYRKTQMIFQRVPLGDPEKLFNYIAQKPLKFQQTFLTLAPKWINYRSGAWDGIQKNELFTDEEKACENDLFLTCPPPDKVEEFMQKFIHDLLVQLKERHDPIEVASFAHRQITTIHPFNDGNGRTARMVMNLILMQGGRKPVIFVSDKQYIEAVRKGDKDPKIFEAYVRKCVEAVEAEET